jgi:hypothetical protein
MIDISNLNIALQVVLSRPVLELQHRFKKTPQPGSNELELLDFSA